MSNDIQSARNSQPIHGLEQVEQRELVPQGTFQGRKVTLLSSSENKQARMSSKRELSECLNQFASLNLAIKSWILKSQLDLRSKALLSKSFLSER